MRIPPLRVFGAAVAVLAAAPLFPACRSTGKAAVADFAAERIYQEDRYERACVEVVGPREGCRKMQALLQQLERTDPADKTKKLGLIPVANQVQMVGGQLPDQEREELEGIFRVLRSLP